jgi:Fic family protein
MEVASMKSLNSISKLLASELMPKKTFDNNAQTCEDIARFSGMSARSASRYILALVESGKLERVWKRGRIRPIPAYRIAVNR